MFAELGPDVVKKQQQGSSPAESKEKGGFSYVELNEKKSPRGEDAVKSFEEKPASDPVVGNAVDPVLDEFVDNYGNDWFLCKQYRFYNNGPE